MIRENNYYTNQTVTYTYDTNNNILSKTVYSVTQAATLSGGTTYTYIYDATNPDRLTNYNGQSISYNNLGMPTSYMGANMTWDGYNLNSLTSNGVTYTYKYDQNGLRLSKTASNGTTTQYLRDANGRLIRETDGTNTIWYLYDQNGFIGFEYNGTSYYYITNLQGDVLKIVNANGAVVANYTYDSWGKVIASSGSMANINPIRYRGYYYDQEIQLYFT